MAHWQSWKGGERSSHERVREQKALTSPAQNPREIQVEAEGQEWAERMLGNGEMERSSTEGTEVSPGMWERVSADAEIESAVSSARSSRRLSSAMWNNMYGSFHASMGPFSQMMSGIARHEIGIGGRTCRNLHGVLGGDWPNSTDGQRERSTKPCWRCVSRKGSTSSEPRYNSFPSNHSTRQLRTFWNTSSGSKKKKLISYRTQ